MADSGPVQPHTPMCHEKHRQNEPGAKGHLRNGHEPNIAKQELSAWAMSQWAEHICCAKKSFLSSKALSPNLFLLPLKASLFFLLLQLLGGFLLYFSSLLLLARACLSLFLILPLHYCPFLIKSLLHSFALLFCSYLFCATQQDTSHRSFQASHVCRPHSSFSASLPTSSDAKPKKTRLLFSPEAKGRRRLQPGGKLRQPHDHSPMTTRKRRTFCYSCRKTEHVSRCNSVLYLEDVGRIAIKRSCPIQHETTGNNGNRWETIFRTLSEQENMRNQ